MSYLLSYLHQFSEARDSTAFRAQPIFETREGLGLSYLDRVIYIGVPNGI